MNGDVIVQGVVVTRTVNSNGSTEALEHISDPGATCHYLHKVFTMVVTMTMTMTMTMIATMTRMMMTITMITIMMMMMMIIFRMTPQWQLCPSAPAGMCTA